MFHSSLNAVVLFEYPLVAVVFLLQVNVIELVSSIIENWSLKLMFCSLTLSLS